MTSLLEFLPDNEVIIHTEYNDNKEPILVRSTIEGTDVKIETRALDITRSGETVSITRRFTFSDDKDKSAILDQIDYLQEDPNTGKYRVIHSEYETIKLPGIKEGENLGKDLATPLSNLMFGDAGLFGKAIGGAVLKSVLSNVGEIVGGGVDHLFRPNVDTNSSLIEALAEQAFADVVGDGIINLSQASTGAVSKIWIAEIFNGGPDGPGEEILAGITTALIDGALNHGLDLLFEEVFVDLLSDAAVIKTLTDFKPTTIYTDPFTTAFTISLNAILPDLDTLEGEIASAISAAISKAIFAALGASNPFTAAVAPVLGWAVGKLFDELFGEDNFAFGEITYDLRTGEFALGDVFQEGSSNPEEARVMAQGLVDSMNEIVRLSQSKTHNFDELRDWKIGLFEGEVKNEGEDGKVFASPKDAFFDAYLSNVSELALADGRASIARAIDAVNIEKVRSLQELRWLQDALIEFERQQQDEMHETQELHVIFSDGESGFEYFYRDGARFQEVLEDLLQIRYGFETSERDPLYRATGAFENGEYEVVPGNRDTVRKQFDELMIVLDPLLSVPPTYRSMAGASVVQIEFRPSEDENSIFPGSRAFLDLLGVDRIYSDGELVQQILANLQTAERFEEYVENHDIIDEMISIMPESNFSAGWLLNLFQADALELADTYNVSGQGIIGGTKAPNGNLDNIFHTSFGNDIVRGRLGDDEIYTKDGDDYAVGGLGADILEGGDGDDILIGGEEPRTKNSSIPLNDIAFGEIEWISDAFDTSGWESFNTRQMFFGNFEGDNKAEFVGLLRHSDDYNHSVVEAHIRSADGESFISLDRDEFVNASIQNHTPRGSADVNGDGYDDLLAIWSDGRVWTGLANGDGTFADPILGLAGEFGRDQGWITQSRYTRTFDDVDGDGLADLIGFGPSGVKVALGQNDGTFNAEIIDAHPDFRDGVRGWLDQFETPRTVGDVNADGRADIVAFKDTEVHVALGQADGTFGAANIKSSAMGRLAADGFIEAFGNSDHFPRRLGDINGDGFDDIIVFNHDPSPYGGYDLFHLEPEIFVMLNNGDGTFSDMVSISVPSLPENTRDDDFDWLRFDVVDVDGDGRDDLAGFTYDRGVWVMYSQGDEADFFVGGGGNDELQGGLGADVARYTGDYVDYIFDASNDGRLRITDTRDDSPDGQDLLQSVELLEFNDAILQNGTAAADELQISSDAVSNDIDLYIRGGTGRDHYVFEDGGTDTRYEIVDYEADESITLPSGLDFVESPDGSLNPGQYTYGQEGDYFLIRWKGEASNSIFIRGVDPFDSVEVAEDPNPSDDTTGRTTSPLTAEDSARAHLNSAHFEHASLREGEWVKLGALFSADRAAASGAQSFEVRSIDEAFRLRNANSEVKATEGLTFENPDEVEVMAPSNAGSSILYVRVTDGEAQSRWHSLEVAARGPEYDRVLDGTASDDDLRGGNGVDRIRGHSGDDYIAGGFYNDHLAGDAGSDRINGDAGDDNLNGGQGDDTLDGGDGSDRIQGSSGNDILRGRDGNDTLGGHTGDDQLFGGNDNDVLDGGDGNDVVAGDDGQDTLRGGEGEDQVWGGAGADIVRGENGDDELFGGAGNDRVLGEAGNDKAYGGDGDDLVDGGVGEGSDWLIGGGGSDEILGRNGSDTLAGRNGDDRLLAGGGDDRADGGNGDDAVDGGAGQDTVLGGDGNDELWGRAGADIVRGENGDDKLFGGAGNDRVLGEAGSDQAYGGDGNDLIDGGLGGGADLLFGGVGDDKILGRNGNDKAWGGLGDDTISGGDGDDVINGGRGNDTLIGNSGADTFQFRSNDGSDTINGFQQEQDLIEIVAGADGFNDLEISQSGRNVLIEFANVDIVVTNAQVAEFVDDDFIFS